MHPPPPLPQLPRSTPFCLQSQRRFFPPFSLCGYSFSLLADPRGNPRATNQVPAGAPRVEKGLSVYLTVLFQEDPPDAPPWGGSVAAASSHGFPPPPLPLGPGHPWGAAEEGEEEDEEDQDRARLGVLDVEQGGGLALRATGDGVSDENGKGDAKEATAAWVKRDPHGLRRRRRRARTREGKAPVVSHLGDSAAIARECCAGFSLTAVNKDSDKDVMWISSMKRDRFFPGRSSWGVHCLVPMSTFQVRFLALSWYYWCGLVVRSVFAPMRPLRLCLVLARSRCACTWSCPTSRGGVFSERERCRAQELEVNYRR